MFWKCTPVQASHESLCVQFQKRVYIFWSEEREAPPSGWRDILHFESEWELILGTRAIWWNFKRFYVLLSWRERDALHWSITYTIFRKGSPDEAMNGSRCVHFQNIVCHFWAERAMHRPFPWMLQTIFWKSSPVDARHESPCVLFQNIVWDYWSQERAMHRCYEWSELLRLEIVSKMRLRTRALSWNCNTLHATSELTRERCTAVPQEVTYYVLKL